MLDPKPDGMQGGVVQQLDVGLLLWLAEQIRAIEV